MRQGGGAGAQHAAMHRAAGAWLLPRPICKEARGKGTHAVGCWRGATQSFLSWTAPAAIPAAGGVWVGAHLKPLPTLLRLQRARQMPGRPCCR